MMFNITKQIKYKDIVSRKNDKDILKGPVRV
jgi:hypothetical protein